MDLELQRLLFGFVLAELDQQPDLTNQCIEVSIDEFRENVASSGTNCPRTSDSKLVWMGASPCGRQLEVRLGIQTPS